jgi:hypothetical protein
VRNPARQISVRSGERLNTPDSLYASRCGRVGVIGPQTSTCVRSYAGEIMDIPAGEVRVVRLLGHRLSTISLEMKAETPTSAHTLILVTAEVFKLTVPQLNLPQLCNRRTRLGT